ncbi:MAG: hypothetical protein WA838_12035 [Xanthobacteraceae bacterium]
MREHDDYDDENIRLYTPVLQRVIILAAVIIAVPVLMWTITTFVRSYVARPKLPALEHVASTNTPPRLTANAPAPPGSASSPADQSAPPPVEGSSASDAAKPASPAPDAANSLPAASLRTTLAQTPSPAIAAPAATATSDASTANPATASVGSAPRPVPRSTDNAASTSAPSSSDRGIAWPNPNMTGPPDFAATRLPPPPPPARTAAAEVLPPDEPIRGPVPLPRQRPGIFAVAVAAAATTTGPVPLPRARPTDAPAEAANTVIEPAYGYRPGLDSDR